MLKNTILFLLPIFALLLPSSAHAATTTLSLTPPVVEIILTPGKQLTQTFTLKHGDQLDSPFVPELHLVKPRGDSGHVDIDLDPINQNSLPITIDFSSKIQGTDSTTYTLTFEAASVENPTDVYLTVLFRQHQESSSADSTITLPSISALIFVTIEPSEFTPVDLRITDFDLPLYHDSWTTFTPTPKLANNAAVMIRPTGTYEIMSPSGKIIFSVPLYQNLILANSSRLIRGDANPPTLAWKPSWQNIGPYRVKLTISTQGGTKLTEVEKTIFLIPIRLIIIISFALILSLTLISKRIKFKRV